MNLQRHDASFARVAAGALPWLLAAAFIGLSGVPSVANAQKADLIKYVVKPGDDCKKILKKVYGSTDYKLIHRYNKLGPTPHNLVPGTILRIPKPDGAGPDAHLTGVNGAIQTRPPKRKAWNPAQRGAELYSAWRVNSLEQASAEITFQDDSLLYMRENTIVIIYGPTYTNARRKVRRAELKTGALRTFVDDVAGKKGSAGLEVTTDAVVAELGATAALMTVDDSGTTRVANHAGAPVALTPASKGKRKAKGARKSVKQGMGTRAVPGKEIEDPRPLPPAPEWAVEGPLVFATFGDVGTVSASWKASGAGTKARIEVSSDPDGRSLLRSITVPGTVDVFEMQELPVGRYYVAVAAIDEIGLEGPQSKRIALDLKSVALKTLGGRADGGRVWVGTTVELVEGMTCNTDEGPETGQVVLDTPGEVSLACEVGGTSVLLPKLVVDSPPISFGDARSSIEVGVPTHFLATVPADIGALRVSAGDAKVENLRQEGEELSFDLLATVPGEIDIQILATVGERSVTLATQKVAATEEGTPPAEPDEERFWLAGGFGGAAIAPSEDAYELAVESMPRLGLTFGIRPWQTVGFEVEAGGAIAPIKGSAGKRRVAFYRGVVRTRLADLAFAPSLVLGVGQERFLLDDPITVSLGYAGLGLRYWLDPGTVGFETQILGSMALGSSWPYAATEFRVGLLRAF